MSATPLLSSAKGQALQLLEIKGKVFQLNEDVLKETLERKEVQDLPVCVISIFGEQRKGKSFLLNYLWRRLEHEVNQENQGNQEESHDPWTGKNKEILKGFEWRMGVEPTTRGLWICSKPFILKGKSAKEVAVFLVDTEGTMDVAGNKENSVKISTLNMLFSSYLILNVNEILQEPELEYLEMSLDLINDAFQDHVQNLHLDILVRDWFNSDECNEKQGKEYLKGIVKRIQGNKKFPTVVKLLKSTKAEVHLLPSPGSKITRSTCGTLDEMDPVFKDCFLKYIGLLHSKAKEYTKSKMKCRDLAKLIKEIAGIIENTSYNISSPAEMRKVILELQKKRFVDDFCEWMKTKISQTNYVGCYFTRPSKMKSQFEEEFKNRCKKVKINEETQNYMKKEMDSYLEDYKANFYRKNLSTGLPVVALGAMTLHFHLQD